MRQRQQLVANVDNTASSIDKFPIQAYDGEKSPPCASSAVHTLLWSPSLKFIPLLRCNEVDDFSRLSLISVAVLDYETLRCKKVLVSRERCGVREYFQFDLYLQTDEFSPVYLPELTVE